MKNLIKHTIKTPHLGDKIIDALTTDENSVAYFVGGCVRDSLIGIEPKDWDIATNQTPEEIIKKLTENLKHKSFKINEDDSRFGVIRVTFKGGSPLDEYEIVTFRGDGEYLDKRRPDSIYFSDIITDSTRRDFTINAMYYDKNTQEILDFHGGYDDIINKQIKCVGNPLDRFEEDELRVLRALRFAIRLNFNLDYKTKKSILFVGKNALRGISNERIYSELTKTLSYVREYTNENTIEVLKSIVYSYLSTVFKVHKAFEIVEGTTLPMILVGFMDADNANDKLVELRLPKKEIKEIVLMDILFSDDYYVLTDIFDFKKQFDMLKIKKNDFLLKIMILNNVVHDNCRIGHATIQMISKAIDFPLNDLIKSETYIEKGFEGKKIKEQMKLDAKIKFKTFLNER